MTSYLAQCLSRQAFYCSSSSLLYPSASSIPPLLPANIQVSQSLTGVVDLNPSLDMLPSHHSDPSHYQQSSVPRTQVAIEPGSISPSFSLSSADSIAGYHYPTPLPSRTQFKPRTYEPDISQEASLPSVPCQVTVLHWGPNHGPAGTRVSVRCDVCFEMGTVGQPVTPPLSASSAISQRQKNLRIVFGTYPAQTSVCKLGQVVDGQGGHDRCDASAHVPEFYEVDRPDATVQVWLQVLSEQQVVESIRLGRFSLTRDRKRNGDPCESLLSPPNLVVRRSVSSPVYAQPNQFLSDTASHNTATSVLYGTRPVSSSGQIPASQPSLMRSSHIIGNVPVNSVNTAFINTGQKASLTISGDLNSIAKNWSVDEWNFRRRLVQFWRRQEGTTIHTQFRPVPQSEWPKMQSSIVISCMFWEGKNSCFITSVDIIFLLEALVNTQFTVEEKNRIRRNLEGFRPITVDKSKPDTESFFKQIMNLPNPRPRNIEKNVKVYSWECLEAALQKIIGKYSASFPAGKFNPILAFSDQATQYQHAPMPSSTLSIPTLPSTHHASTGSSVRSYDSAIPPSASGVSLNSGPSLTPQPSNHSLHGGQVAYPQTQLLVPWAADPSSHSFPTQPRQDDRTTNNGSIGHFFDMPQNDPTWTVPHISTMPPNPYPAPSQSTWPFQESIHTQHLALEQRNIGDYRPDESDPRKAYNAGYHEPHNTDVSRRLSRTQMRPYPTYVESDDRVVRPS
ncbi:hypothetical protein L204_101583 [Cryptococcus depauperatus]